MSNFLGNPKGYFADLKGQPLVGGKLFTFEVGTEVDKVSFPTAQDAYDKTNANTNPILLDSRGEPEGIQGIFLSGNTKIVLKDGVDNLIWTIENVPSDGNVLDANGDLMIVYNTVPLAVNHFQFTNAATTENPVIGVDGADNDIGIDIRTKGTGSINLQDSSGNTIVELRGGVPLAVNRIVIEHAATGDAAKLFVDGPDTDISIDIAAKGAGIIQLGNTTTIDGSLTTEEGLLVKGATALQGPVIIDGATTINSGIVDIRGQPTVSANLRLREATDNGLESISLSPPTELASTINYILPVDGLNGQVLSTDGEGILNFRPQGALAWVRFSSSGNILSSYNVSSVVSLGGEMYQINYITPMANTNYLGVATTLQSGTSAFLSFSALTISFSTIVASTLILQIGAVLFGTDLEDITPPP